MSVIQGNDPISIKHNPQYGMEKDAMEKGTKAGHSK